MLRLTTPIFMPVTPLERSSQMSSQSGSTTTEHCHTRHRSDRLLQRRKVHREAEQRRKLKITSCIDQISRLLPSCHYHSRETSAEVLERAIGRVKELKAENNVLKQIQSPDVSFDQLQQRMSQLAVQHITMVTAILEHLQKQQNTISYTPDQLLTTPLASEQHVTSSLKSPPPNRTSSSKQDTLQSHTAERMKFGIADLLPDTVSRSNPPPLPPSDAPANYSHSPPVWRPYSIHQDTPPSNLLPHSSSNNFLVGNLLQQ